MPGIRLSGARSSMHLITQQQGSSRVAALVPPGTIELGVEGVVARTVRESRSVLTVPGGKVTFSWRCLGVILARLGCGVTVLK